jgi:hypothetical protein
MPIYDFYCPENNKLYSFYARTLAHADCTPRCPDNPKFRMERAISRFAVTGRAKEKPETPGGGPEDDPRMGAMMAEMEREFSGMDTANPDPRQLARMMRKMSALTGEKVPGEMEEMIRRLETGEDPEKLEEEYGDTLGDFDPKTGEGGPSGGEESVEKAGIREHLRALRRKPLRDPVLYEMADYLS